MTPFSTVSGMLLINVMLQVTVLAGLLLVLIRILRGKSLWRYHLAFSGLIAVTALLVSSVWLQSRDVSLLSMRLPVPVTLLEARAVDAAVTSQSGASRLQGVEFEAAPDIGLGFEQLLANLLATFTATEVQDDTVGSSGALAMATKALLVVWLAGTLYMLLRLLASITSLRQLIQRSKSPDLAQQQRLSRILHTFSNEQPRYLLSAYLRSPVHVGYLTPVIILPDDLLANCDDERLQAVLLHELAHWQRRDNIANLLQQLIVALFWFHPLVRWLSQIADRSREELCDNFVLQQQDPLHYCETLLWFGSRARHAETTEYPASVAMFDRHWNLEQRIQELIDKKRETNMTLSTSASITFRLTLIIATAALAALTVNPTVSQAQVADDTQIAEEQEPRPAPQARDAETLSETVFEAISQIQELMVQPQSMTSGELAEAKRLLDALYEAEFGAGNSFEKLTILNFYTNYHLLREDYPEALTTFERILAINELRENARLRTLRSLGQLYAAEERWQESIEAFVQWQDLSEETDPLVLRGLAYGHYQLQQWQSSREYWLQYLATQDSAETSRDDLAFLNGLHYQLQDWQSALTLTQEMIVRFNEERDWGNLRVIYERLDDQDALAGLDPELGGTLDIDAPEPEIAFANVVPTDGDYMPLLATAPMYPRVAADERIEGWVLVEFTVGSDGHVNEDSVTVVDAEPADVFNANSMRAAREFVFAPRMVAGEAVPVPGVRYLFRFRLGDDDA